MLTRFILDLRRKCAIWKGLAALEGSISFAGFIYMYAKGLSLEF